MATYASRILPWQFGMLGLKEAGGQRYFKYEDRLIDGVSYSSSSVRGLSIDKLLTSLFFEHRLHRMMVSLFSTSEITYPLDTHMLPLGFAIYKNQTAVWNVFA